MNEEIENVISLVEAAQKKGTFSLVDAVKGKANPKDSVEIYLDAETAYELNKLNEELTGEPDPEKHAALEAKAAELVEKIKQSKVTFHMRGIDQRETELIEDKIRKVWGDDGDEVAILTEYLCALVAANIVSVEDADGNVDEHVFTAREMMNIREAMPVESWNKLVQTMQGLTLATGYFKGLTDAGFLPKS
jgi:hypothetical protein